MFGIKDQMELWDKNFDKKIAKAFINSKGRYKNEVFVIYEDGTREVIIIYDPNRMEYSHTDFIGKSKAEAIFEHDRKRNSTSKDYYGYGKRY